ncbi:unnamed protein product, partial [Closterium sp. Naga37s-1]
IKHPLLPETLDMPLPELEKLATVATLDVTFHDKENKVELSHPEVQLRLLGVFPDRICQILPHTEKIENIDTQKWTIHAEE